MIWKKTSAGQAELKAHAAGLRAAAQNLLMILDGAKTEEMLLANLIGVTREDFRTLAQLGLIEAAGPIAAGSGNASSGGQSAPAGTPVRTGLDRQFAAALAGVIKTHLGLGGFRLLGACERASTSAELHDLARITIDLIHQRRGAAAAQEARWRLERSAASS